MWEPQSLSPFLSLFSSQILPTQLHALSLRAGEDIKSLQCKIVKILFFAHSMLMSQGKSAMISLATQFTAMGKGLSSHSVDQAGLSSHYVDQAGLQLMERPIFLCLMSTRTINVCSSMPGKVFFFFNKMPG